MEDMSKRIEQIRSANTPRWREFIPWWIKIGAKLVLSRLPVSGRTWQKLGLFSPGLMLNADYAIAVFRLHYERTGKWQPGFTYLELGPGDSLATAAVAWAHGAECGWLVDAGTYAVRDIAVYRPLFQRLSELRAELRLPRNALDLLRCKTIGELLAATGCCYSENGLTGLRALRSGSVDFALSHVTLEHIPRGEFNATITELYRLLKPSGRTSHQVDFKDHLGGSLNNLRLPGSLWERPWFAWRSGFYTNRLRISEIVSVFEVAGFELDVQNRELWPTIPLPRGRLAREFQNSSDEDLRTHDALLIARKNVMEQVAS